MTYFLYVKHHNKTNLSYLGRTTKNPFLYKGSGKYWKKHIKKHGYNVTTIVIGEYETEEKLKEAGLYYSNLWNVVEDRQWANQIPENGYGWCGPQTPEHSKKIAQSNKGKPKSESHRKAMSLARMGKIPWNKGLTKETDKRMKKISLSNMGKSRPHTEETKKKMSHTRRGKKRSWDTWKNKAA